MNWLRIVLGLTALTILIGTGISLFNFKKELKSATNEDRSLSNEFVERWEKKIKMSNIGIVIAAFLGFIAIILTY